jgi:predicted NAD/FAD-binding protein
MERRRWQVADTREKICVTLDRGEHIGPERVSEQTPYDHPVYHPHPVR